MLSQDHILTLKQQISQNKPYQKPSQTGEEIIFSHIDFNSMQIHNKKTYIEFDIKIRQLRSLFAERW